ncbi:hypothetical protein A2975_03190, partial [Candidatus Woesebacteria bacterium RIFCSPLOWO2_01_FULL_44_14]
MKFSDLALFLEKLEATSSRIEITKILANLFGKANANEIDKIVYLILGRLAPTYENVVFSIAERMMVVAIADAYKKEKSDVQKKYKELGDLGLTAYTLAKTTGLHDLAIPSVPEVYDELRRIAKDEGEKSVERKISGIAKLISRLDPLSVKFVTRIPVGRLRLGFSDKTILDALSWLEKGDKSAKRKLEKAYNMRPDIGYLAKLVKTKGLKDFSAGIKPDIKAPIAPMLAQRLKSPEEMVAKMGLVSVEPKYDGLRILIHYKKPDYLRTYTRNLNFIDKSVFPELASLGKCIKADEVILDTEAVGMDPKRQRLVDFQTTMQRRRKHGVTAKSGDIPLQFQVFDVLLKDGQSLLGEKYVDRRAILERTIINGPIIKIDEHTLTNDPREIKKLHKKYLKLGFEGIIVKKADSHYVSGRTGWRWVKMKEVETAAGKLADTIDCVVMGYTTGKGKRVGFGVGQFLAGIRAAGKIKTITKVGTGLTDEQFRELKSRLTKLEVKDKPLEYDVHKDLGPDFWVQPSLVVELAADEVTKSPKHTAGLALRFPR